MSITKVEFGDWKNCIRLANEAIELVVTTDVGPRIIYAGFRGGQNLLCNMPGDAGKTGGDNFRLYGGHRFWHAPEDPKRTYVADNDPVPYELREDSVVLSPVAEKVTGIQKRIEVSLEPSANRARIEHTFVNRGPWAVELAPWALTMMAPGGFFFAPQEDYRPHPDFLLPARPLVLWHFTKMTDPRWRWSDRYIYLRQDPKASGKQKCGMMNKQRWAGYALNGDVFLKSFGYDSKANYPDYGCNCETYTDPDFLEVESLGPLTTIEPGESIDHVEHWLLAKAAVDINDADIDAKIRPILPQLRFE